MMPTPDRRTEQKCQRFGVAAVLGGILLVVSVYLVTDIMDRVRAPARDVWSRIQPGDSEAAVLELLGPPAFTCEGGSAPADYYLDGYGRRERPITGKVLIYREGDMVFYVWISRDRVVEEVFEGVS